MLGLVEGGGVGVDKRAGAGLGDVRRRTGLPDVFANRQPDRQSGQCEHAGLVALSEVSLFVEDPVELISFFLAVHKLGLDRRQVALIRSA